MQLNRTITPVVDPISLSRVKEFLRIEHNDEDTTLNGLIQTATNICERYLSRSLITQTWTMFVDTYPARLDWIPLSYGPIQSITSIKSYTEADTIITNDTSTYFLANAEQNGKAVLSYGEVWDSSVLRPANGVEIIYDAGYGDDPEDIPFEIRQGILSLIAYFYEHREEMGSGVPEHVTLMWSPHKVWSF